VYAPEKPFQQPSLILFEKAQPYINGVIVLTKVQGTCNVILWVRGFMNRVIIKFQVNVLYDNDFRLIIDIYF
jgi:hypothetical protein